MTDEKSTSRNFRVPDKLWDEAKKVADSRYEKLSDVLRRALVEYVEKNRPAAGSWTATAAGHVEGDFTGTGVAEGQIRTTEKGHS